MLSLEKDLASTASTDSFSPGAGISTTFQSSGYDSNPQKFSGRSNCAPSRKLRPSGPMGWQKTTYAVTCRPPRRCSRRALPASSFCGKRSAQPCAFTTSVSQISENEGSGPRLVTRTGTLAVTLELRRTMCPLEAGIVLLCVARDSDPRDSG